MRKFGARISLPGASTRFRLRVLHRWIGIGAAAFLLLLCVTGIALNHSSALGLDANHIGRDWLLDWYGIRAPEFGPGFNADGRWITLAGERLYLDAIEIAGAGLDDLVGAVVHDGALIVAGPDQILTVSPEAEVIDSVPSGLVLPGTVAAIAAGGGTLWLSVAGQTYAFDPISLAVEPAAIGARRPAWAVAGTTPPALRAAIESAHRGRGLSIERVVTDLHSGRLFGIGGVAMMDLAALAMGFLAISGILLWFRR